MNLMPFKKLDASKRKLVEKALAVRKKAYAPYSRYWVGCVVRDDKNRLHTGCNVENASYPAGLCAERVAITKMISEGGNRIKELILVGSSDGPVLPCGMCRQVIQEFGAKSTIISVDPKKRQATVVQFSDIFPEAFTPEHLQK